MVDPETILQKKLEVTKNQHTWNLIIGIFAFLIMLFNPWVKFENLTFKVSAENIIALIVFVICLAKGFSLRNKIEDLEGELSIYSESGQKNMRDIPKVIQAKEEPIFRCGHCGTKFSNHKVMENHFLVCIKSKKDKELDEKIDIWIIRGLGITLFIVLAVYFFIHNKINLIALILIGIALTPIPNKLLGHYYKNHISKKWEWNWWKKALFVIFILIIFIGVNAFRPTCPSSCEDYNSCTMDSCSSETKYLCKNTVIADCLGNGLCESGEYGTLDCPNCDDGKRCTGDSYDIQSKKCINVEIIGCEEENEN